MVLPTVHLATLIATSTAVTVTLSATSTMKVQRYRQSSAVWVCAIWTWTQTRHHLAWWTSSPAWPKRSLSWALLETRRGEADRRAREAPQAACAPVSLVEQAPRLAPARSWACTSTDTRSQSNVRTEHRRTFGWRSPRKLLRSLFASSTPSTCSRTDEQDGPSPTNQRRRWRTTHKQTLTHYSHPLGTAPTYLRPKSKPREVLRDRVVARVAVLLQSREEPSDAHGDTKRDPEEWKLHVVAQHILSEVKGRRHQEPAQHTHEKCKDQVRRAKRRFTGSGGGVQLALSLRRLP